MNRFRTIDNVTYFVRALKGQHRKLNLSMDWMWGHLSHKEKEIIRDEYPELILKHPKLLKDKI